MGLIDADVDVEVTTKDDSSALHAAASQGHDTIVKVLIEAGADIHKVTESGDSALSLAAVNGHAKCVQALLSNGAQENVAWRSKFNLSVVEARNHNRLPPFKQRGHATFMW